MPAREPALPIPLHCADSVAWHAYADAVAECGGNLRHLRWVRRVARGLEKTPRLVLEVGVWIMPNEERLAIDLLAQNFGWFQWRGSRSFYPPMWDAYSATPENFPEVCEKYPKVALDFYRTVAKTVSVTCPFCNVREAPSTPHSEAAQGWRQACRPCWQQALPQTIEELIQRRSSSR